MARFSAVPVFGFICSLAMGNAQALSQSASTEQPWVDIAKYPLDVHELNAAGVTTSSIQPRNKLFILVKDRADEHSSSIATSYGDSVVVTTTGSGEVQIGNGKIVKTFHVQAGLSQCYAQITEVGCISNGRKEEVGTGSQPGGR